MEQHSLIPSHIPTTARVPTSAYELDSGFADTRVRNRVLRGVSQCEKWQISGDFSHCLSPHDTVATALPSRVHARGRDFCDFMNGFYHG